MIPFLEAIFLSDIFKSALRVEAIQAVRITCLIREQARKGRQSDWRVLPLQSLTKRQTRVLLRRQARKISTSILSTLVLSLAATTPIALVRSHEPTV